MKVSKKVLDDLTYRVIGSAIEVHKNMGPGLLESVYDKCLCRELNIRKIRYLRQGFIPLSYKGVELESQFRFDLLVEDLLVVELKAIDAIHPIFESQVLTYMKLLNVPKGLILNFNCLNMFREGQKTLVNEIYRELPA